MGLYKMASFRTEHPINVSYESYSLPHLPLCPPSPLGIAYHSCPLEVHTVSGEAICR